MNVRATATGWLGGCLAVMLLSAGPAFAQTGTVSGVVTDAATGQPLNNARVVVVGTNISIGTNEEGRYLLLGVPVGEQEVRASLIGYGQQTHTITVSAGETSARDFDLDVSAIALEAIVVNAATGREQRARELGSKVATIDLDEYDPTAIATVADALSGRTEGMIMQDVNGTTGTAQRIRIRGANSLSLSNDPLVYVDGVRMSTDYTGFGVGGQESSRLNDLNPGDIASIEVVKGPAAAALYGTAAANGVLLITTKRGSAGETRWNAYVETGRLDDVTDYPTNWLAYDVLDSAEPLFAESGLLNTAGYGYCANFAAAEGDCSQDGVTSFNTLEDPRTAFHTRGTRNRYGASVQGGSADLRYFISGQYEDETGVISYNTLEKANFRANVNARLSPEADLAVSVGYTDAQLALNNNDNSIFSPIINGLVGYPNYIPPADDAADEVNRLNYIAFGFNKSDLANLPSDQEIDRFITSANLQWRPQSWLTLNATGGLDLMAHHSAETLQPGELPIAVSYANGYRQSERTNDYAYTANVSAVSTFELRNDLVSTTTVGGSFNRDYERNTFCYGSFIVAGTSSCSTAADLFSVAEEFFEVRTIGAYVQEQLSWRNRVFLALGLRGDDNSAFGTDFGLAYYPSASLSWVVGEEAWFPEYDWLTGLRVRSAWGASGLHPSFRDAPTLYEATTVASGGSDLPGVTLDNTGNLGLEPERTTEWEAGFDAGLFDDRLGFDFTYFHKRSKDALVERPLPGSLGLTGSIWENLGSVVNSGTELTARFSVLNRPDVGLDLGITNTTLSNEIEDLGRIEALDKDIEPIIFNRGLQRHAEGRPAGSFFQREVRWDDANDDGLLALDEVSLADTATYVGSALPTWQRSVFANLRVFDWVTLSTTLEGRGGHFTGNDSESFRCGTLALNQFGCAAVANPDASLEEQAAFLADRFLGSAAGYIEKADFYRWRELSVSLAAPDALADMVPRLAGARLTVAGRNLALFTDYPGLDPETVEGGGTANFSQSEFNTQPPVRYLMVRLDYTF